MTPRGSDSLKEAGGRASADYAGNHIHVEREFDHGVVRAGDAFSRSLARGVRIVSAKNGCAPEGACGCCAVLVDGQPVLACLRKPEHMEGHDVVTLEGVPEEMRRVLGEAFLLEGGGAVRFLHSRYCDARVVMVAEQGRTEDREAVAKALDGHIAAAPATRESSTRFRPPAKRGRTA